MRRTYIFDIVQERRIGGQNVSLLASFYPLIVVYSYVSISLTFLRNPSIVNTAELRIVPQNDISLKYKDIENQ
jgi:hypothetical protein